MAKKITQSLKEFIPPVILKSLKKIFTRFGQQNVLGRAKNTRYYYIDAEDKIYTPESLNYVMGLHAFNIPSERLRYAGGLAFNLFQNPLLIYYNFGVEKFAKYYHVFKPKNIYERHFIWDHISKSNACTNELPWIYDMGSNDSRKKLAIHHYGPLSQKELNFEKKRLDSVLKSIKENGFVLSLANGYPQGYFLQNKTGAYVFVVVNMQHRVAAMVQLGIKNIRLCFRPDYPRLIKESDSAFWPAVRLGQMTEQSALRIFNAYFRDENVSVFDMMSAP